MNFTIDINNYGTKRVALEFFYSHGNPSKLPSRRG